MSGPSLCQSTGSKDRKKRGAYIDKEQRLALWEIVSASDNLDKGACVKIFYLE
jgi:hypothetical protein